MKKIICILATVGILAFAFPAKEKINIFLAGDSTCAIKETKAYPETGWGMPFVHFWDSSVNIINKAKNGRSTKTFISEGLWQSIISNAKEGDYVFIQFGHNDESPTKLDRYTPPTEFKNNLVKFIKETRNKKAIPVLFTPVSRRNFDTTGKMMETHKIYSALVKEVAADQQTLLIDLDEKSRALYQSFGEENSKIIILTLRTGSASKLSGWQNRQHPF